MLRKIRKIKEKVKKELTVEDILDRKPKRGPFEYYVEEGIVKIKVQKFESKLGKALCRLLHRDETFTVTLDKIGSTVWNLCDGNTTVQKILETLKEKFPEEENLDKRLFLFLYQMHSLHYITL